MLTVYFFPQWCWYNIYCIFLSGNVFGPKKYNNMQQHVLLINAVTWKYVSYVFMHLNIIVINVVGIAIFIENIVIYHGSCYTSFLVNTIIIIFMWYLGETPGKMLLSLSNVVLALTICTFENFTILLTDVLIKHIDKFVFGRNL